MIASIDKYGRILIPKKLRELLGITENISLQLRHVGGQIIIEPLKEENLYKEEAGFLFFNGNIPSKKQDLLETVRTERDNKLLGL